VHIGILSRGPNLYSTRRLVEAGEEHGHEMHVIDYLRCYMNITSAQPQVIYQGESLNDFDALIPRISAKHTSYGTAVLRQFEMMKLFTINSSIAILRSRNKLRSLQILARKGVELPVTGYAHTTSDVSGLLKMVGGPPVVIKVLEGTQGNGVVLAETKKAAESVIGAFRGLDANILVQEFIKEAKGEDVRCVVVGEKVVAAIVRRAQDDDFRSNLHQGGTAERAKITPAERKTAVQAAKELGLAVAGVDLLRSSRGPVVLEVNSSPGLEGVERTTGKDVAGHVIGYIDKNINIGKKRAQRAKG